MKLRRRVLYMVDALWDALVWACGVLVLLAIGSHAPYAMPQGAVVFVAGVFCVVFVLRSMWCMWDERTSAWAGIDPELQCQTCPGRGVR